MLKGYSSRTRIKATNLVLLLVSIVLALLFADIGIKLMFYNKPIGPPRGLYQPDPDRGYAMTPNWSGVQSNTVPFEIRTNSRGYRDDEWTFDEPLRILAVGDSFTFGHALSIDEGFVSKINRRLGPNIRVYNAGVGGYGVPHILKTIERECPIIKPKHVVYFYYLNDTRWDNMLLDAVGVRQGYLVTLLKRGQQAPDEHAIAARIASLGHTAQFRIGDVLKLYDIRRFLSERQIHPRQLIERVSKPGDDYEDRYISSNTDDYSNDLTLKAGQIIHTMRDSAKICGADFTMVILPGYAEVYYGTNEPATARLLPLLSDIDILDLRAVAPRGKSLVQAEDAHYNASGTSWAAEHVAQQLQRLYPQP